MGDQTGMKTGWWRSNPDNCQAIADRNAEASAVNPRWSKDSSDRMDAIVAAAGWADRYPSTHIMNAHRFMMQDVMTDAFGDRPKQFKGNVGWVRFITPYWDARDKAWVSGMSAFDASTAGYKAMCNHYGVDAPFWAWWD